MSNDFVRRDAADIRKMLDAERLTIEGLDIFRLRTQTPPMAVRLDTSVAGTTYVGEALPGTLPSSPTWRIKKVLTSGSALDILWADGKSDYAFAWDDRAGLAYS